MNIRSAGHARSQQQVASAGVETHSKRATLTNSSLNFAAALLAAAALVVGAASGWHRGADFPSSLAWAAVGIAAVLGAIFIPSALRVALTGRQLGQTATLAAAYALCAGMAVAVALGNAHQGRDLQADTAKHDTAAVARAVSEHAAAQASLEAMPFTRPAAAVKADIAAKLSSRTDLQGCEAKWLESSKARAACLDVQRLRAELATSERRADLESAVIDASRRLDTSKPAAAPNADAAAIATYLAAFGWNVPAATVVLWLQALAVATVEIGAGLLLAATGGHHRQQSKASGNDSGNGKTNAATNPLAPTQSPQAIGTLMESPESDAIAERLNGGPLVGRQRDLAEIFGLPVTTFRRRVESDPRLKLTATPTGSKLELVVA